MDLLRAIVEENQAVLGEKLVLKQDCCDGLSKFDERFHVVTTDGRPVVNIHYRIRASTGEVFEGITDSQGLTSRIWTEFPANLSIEFFER